MQVFLLEPDSLPNLITNMWAAKCKDVAADYKNGIAVAIRKLSPLGTVYLDAGWSGWIGSWAAESMAKLMAEVIELAGSSAIVRGFVTNVSNYGSTSSEVEYGKLLLHHLATVGHGEMRFIIDTSRNAGGQVMDSQKTWCNANGAGMGRPPTAHTGISRVDAFLWVKPPGESDGTSDPNAPRFDPSCAQPTSMPNAPQAGEWFHDAFVMLAHNAKPSLRHIPEYVSSPKRMHPPPLPRPSPEASPPAPRRPLTAEEFFELLSHEVLSPPLPPPQREAMMQNKFDELNRSPPLSWLRTSPPMPGLTAMLPLSKLSPTTTSNLKEILKGAQTSWIIALVLVVSILLLLGALRKECIRWLSGGTRDTPDSCSQVITTQGEQRKDMCRRGEDAQPSDRTNFVVDIEEGEHSPLSDSEKRRPKRKAASKLRKKKDHMCVPSHES